MSRATAQKNVDLHYGALSKGLITYEPYLVCISQEIQADLISKEILSDYTNVLLVQISKNSF